MSCMLQHELGACYLVDPHSLKTLEAYLDANGARDKMPAEGAQRCFLLTGIVTHVGIINFENLSIIVMITLSQSPFFAKSSSNAEDREHFVDGAEALSKQPTSSTTATSGGKLLFTKVSCLSSLSSR